MSTKIDGPKCLNMLNTFAGVTFSVKSSKGIFERKKDASNSFEQLQGVGG